MTAPISSNIDKLEAEVPKELLNEWETLDKAMKENKNILAQIKDMNPVNELNSLETKMAKLAPLINRQKTLIKEERLKSAALAEKIGLDQRIAANIQRGREQSSKNPQYGRIQSLDYLHEVASLNERQLDNLWGTVQKLRQMLQRLQQVDGDPTMLSHSDLADHIQRFDKIFEMVATQVYTLNESSEKLRDNFVQQRKIIAGPYAVDPFERRRERQRLIDVYSTLKGVDAFPSANVILSLNEYLPKQQMVSAQPQFGTTPFGTAQTQPFASGGTFLFGPRPPLQQPAFSFNLPTGQQQQPQQSIGGTSTLFGGIAPARPTLAPINTGWGVSSAPGAGTTSLFGNTTMTTAAGGVTSTAPLFGGFTSQQQQPQQSIGGSLFGGIAPISANKPALAPFGGTSTAPGVLPSSGVNLFGAAQTSQPQSAQTTSTQPPPPFGFSNTLSSASSGTLFKGSASPQRIGGGIGTGGSLFGGLAK